MQHPCLTATGLRLLVPLSLVAGSLGLGCQMGPGPVRSTGTAGPRSVERRPAPEETLVRGFDVEHYAIDLTLRPEAREIEGTCGIRFVSTAPSLSEVRLDFEGLATDRVQDGAGNPLEFQHTADSLVVVLATPLGAGERGELQVTYGGEPTTGLWFSGERPDGTGPTQVFTQGQTDEARGWFPCLDHPSDRATSEVRVTMPSGWIAFAPGERIDLSENASTRTEHWRMSTPHPSYLASLVAGELVVVEGDWNGIPLYFAAEPVYADWMEASFHETDEILTFLSDYTGIRYPYPKYSQVAVANYPWGGMENISATTLTPLTLDDERGNRDGQSTELVAHEAAHQWFGDLLTCRDWSEIWLNEGFATYMTLLYFEHSRGRDEFRARLRDAQEAYVEEDRGRDRRSTVPVFLEDPDQLFDTRAYQGAAARLHLLRFILGDEDFRAGVRTYAAENAGRSVTTADLRAAMEKVSGRDLSPFFDQWIHGRGFPEFDVRWSWDENDREVTLDVRQVQASGDGTPSAFRLPVDVRVRDDRGTTVHRFELRSRRDRFVFKTASRPFFVRFDDGSAIPKTVTWHRKTSEWLAIANGDDDVNGRRDAVRALGGIAAEHRERNERDEQEKIVAELVLRLLHDSSPWVRADAATALGQARGLEARERLIVAAQTDAEARVRVAALNALQAYGTSPELARVGRSVFEERFSWATMGAAAGLVATAEPRGATIWIREALEEESPHDQLRGHLFGALAKLEGLHVDDELRRWAEDETVHPSARAEAVRLLGERRIDTAKNSRFLTGLLDAENFRLRAATVQALARISDDQARRALRAYYPEARTSGERRAIEASGVVR